MKIEKNIPLPHIRSSVFGDTLRRMKKGHSFVVATSLDRERVWHAANRLGLKVTTQKESGKGYRIWLVGKKKPKD